MESRKNNVHEGHRERVRQRFINAGLSAFSEHEILELLLFYCVARRDVNPLAHSLIDEFGSLGGVFEAGLPALVSRGGLSEKEAVLLALVSQLGDVRRQFKNEKNISLKTSAELGKFLLGIFPRENAEYFYAVSLNPSSRLIACDAVSRGTVNETYVAPRQVAETAIKRGAAKMVVAHNHPSGDVEPSEEDLRLTLKIARALVSVGVELTDHVIVGDNEYYSFGDKGIMKSITRDIKRYD